VNEPVNLLTMEFDEGEAECPTSFLKWRLLSGVHW
jgi:hypothetical protein